MKTSAKRKPARIRKKDWSCHDVEWYIPGRKEPIAYSTVATRDSIGVMAEEYSNLSIWDLQGKLPYDPEARRVLQQYVDAGFGEQVASEWFCYSRKRR